MTVFNRIRTAIATSHDAIERTGYSVAIMSGQMTPNDYVVSLAQLYEIHHALETAVQGTDAADLFYPEMHRTDSLRRDLAHWGYQLSQFDVMPETLATRDLIRATIAEDPTLAIPFIYVLEGSRMGSLFIVKPLAKALDVQPVDGHGLDYHTEGARQTPARLGRWKAEIEQRNWQPSQIDRLETLAVAFMESLNRLYEKLPAGSRPDQDNSAAHAA